MTDNVLRYFEEREELERRVFLELRERFLAEASPEHLKELERLAFAAIKPGCFARGLAPEVLRRLEEAGFRVVDYKVTRLTPELIDELYAFVRLKYKDSWWIMKKVYTEYPMVALLLKGDPGSYEHLSGRLRDLLGPTTPDAGSPGHLRYDLKGVNRVLNLVHAADDPAATLREALVFFSMEEVLRALVSNSEVELKRDEITPEEVVELSRWEIFNRVKTRAADGLEENRGEIVRLLDREAEIVEQNLPIDEERAKLLPIEVELAQWAKRAESALKDRVIEEARAEANVRRKGLIYEKLNSQLVASRIVLALSDEEEMVRMSDFDFTLMAAISEGFVEDDWEELVLHSTWAVMPQMINDLRKSGKLVITGA